MEETEERRRMGTKSPNRILKNVYLYLFRRTLDLKDKVTGLLFEVCKFGVEYGLQNPSKDGDQKGIYPNPG